MKLGGGGKAGGGGLEFNDFADVQLHLSAWINST